LDFALMWLAMTIAMMVPTVTRPMQRAASGSSLRAWKFLLGFVVLWVAAGLPAYAMMTAITWTSSWIFFAWMVAGAYQLMPWTQGKLRDCRSVRFDGRPVAYGMRQGVRCVVSCGPVMIAIMVTAMTLANVAISLALLVGATVVICWEKRTTTTTAVVLAVGLALVAAGAVGAVTLGGSSGLMHHSTSRS
jgi:predicted metal-binding membrane protein